MFRKSVACVIALLVSIPLVPARTAFATMGPENEAQLAARVKAGVAKLGVGPKARVKVKLKDKTKLDGYVSEVGVDYFVVMDTGTGQATKVAYPNVTQVRGHNLSSRTKIIIAASVIAGVIIVLYIVRGAFCDGC